MYTGQHLHTHTELWGLQYHRLDCIVKVPMCNCWKKLWLHVQSCVQPNKFFYDNFLSKVCSHERKMPTHLYVCMLFRCVRFVCERRSVCVVWVFETVTATGAAGTDWLHNLVCSLCLAPWMADCRPQTHIHTHTHLHRHAYTHACLHVRVASPTADGAGADARPMADGDMNTSIPGN